MQPILLVEIGIEMNERDRVQKVMECEGLNAKQFAKEVGISAGTISNIMGGRNKPSLEVMQAILRRFRRISCLWLITGAGSMYISSNGNEDPTRLLFPDDGNDDDASDSSIADNANKGDKVAPYANRPVQEKSPSPSATPQTMMRTVQKIMIFYSDGTFEER